MATRHEHNQPANPHLRAAFLEIVDNQLQANDPPRDVMIPRLIAYGLIYALAGYILAYWVFRRREL